MTRLTDGAEAIVELRAVLYRERAAQYVPLTRPVIEALNRMTQLEKVAELARRAADLAPMTTAPDLVNALWIVHQALAELDAEDLGGDDHGR